MRKLSPNLDREYRLETVFEVPIPEETFSCSSSRWSRMIAWIQSHLRHRSPPSAIGGSTELQLMLGVIGAPLIPLPIQSQPSMISRDIDDNPIEASMARYIIQQYVAAAGGEKALNSIISMCAMGKVQMATSELSARNKNISRSYSKVGKGGGRDMGGFVLWQKKPDLWCLELVLSGCKISAGSDGTMAWRQTPWQQWHSSGATPGLLRRPLQGLDPVSTANLFSNATCIGEKAIDGEDCFVLRIDAESATLRARSSNGVEMIRHTVRGYFSQRTGLLVHLEDAHLLRLKASNEESVYCETTMESWIQDYREVDGIKIAHLGRTAVSLLRFGETADGHMRSRMEETWTVEEVDFNVWGLCMECFMPPGDLEEEKEGCDVMVKSSHPPIRVQAPTAKIGPSKVAAVDISTEEEEEKP